MGNRISRKSLTSNQKKDAAAGVKGSDFRPSLQQNGAEEQQDLKNKLAKAETDRNSLEQELSAVRAWLNRVEVGNSELVEELKNARDKAAALTSELEAKELRISTLETDIKMMQDKLTRTEPVSKESAPTVDSVSEKPPPAEPMETEKDQIIAQCRNEIADLKLELRKKDRSMRQEMRRHSKQFRDVSEEWHSGQDSLIDPESKIAASRSIEIMFLAHQATLARAHSLVQSVSELNSIQIGELEKQELLWKAERSARRESAKDLDIDFGPGAQDCHLNTSLLNMNEEKAES